MNPLLQGHSGTTPETSRNVFIINQGTNEDDSQSDPHPEAGLLTSGRDRTWLQEFTKKSFTAPLVHLQQSRKKNRSTSPLQFRSEKTPATIEADQILLAFQQLANNNNSANFHNNINRISKLPKSLTTTMPTFDGKSEKFELFEDLFQASLKIHNQLTEEDRINYFHSLMREMHYRHLKTLMALPERIWENFWQFFEGNM